MMHEGIKSMLTSLYLDCFMAFFSLVVNISLMSLSQTLAAFNNLNSWSNQIIRIMNVIKKMILLKIISFQKKTFGLEL